MRSAEPPIISGTAGANASIASWLALRVAMDSPFAFAVSISVARDRVEIARQFAGEAAHEFGAGLGIVGAVAIETRVPVVLQRRADARAHPIARDVIGNLERRMVPVERLRASRRSRPAPSGSPCAFAVPARVGAPLPIAVLQTISVGRCGVGLREHDRAIDRFDVVAVDAVDDLPAVRAEALRACRR